MTNTEENSIFRTRFVLMDLCLVLADIMTFEVHSHQDKEEAKAKMFFMFVVFFILFFLFFDPLIVFVFTGCERLIGVCLHLTEFNRKAPSLSIFIIPPPMKDVCHEFAGDVFTGRARLIRTRLIRSST